MDEDAAHVAEEELAQLRHELAAIRAENGRLQRELGDATAREQAALAEGVRLNTELAAATDAASAFDADLSSMRALLEEAAERERDAAARYRELVLRTEPALPPDLVAGETIDAVDASLAAAREIAGRVRSHIEAQAQTARVPAGAPHRAGPDTSAMTPEQKIRYGLAQRAQT
jgi:chromosome segregation ATPase